MICVLHGDCREIMPTLEAESFDAIVTDPPYGIKFMGKKWDGEVAFRIETWEAAFHVLKPGGHLLAFSSTRTYHRMVCAIEDAGFEIRDQLAWIYASGFPKSHDVSKAIDGVAGARRGRTPDLRNGPNTNQTTKGRAFAHGVSGFANDGHGEFDRGPVTSQAAQWQGWGTALKPSHEPIVLARKPLSERTVAANVLAHGTGALNIDATRVPAEGGSPSIQRRMAGAPTSCRPGEYGHTIVNRITPERYEEQRPGEAIGRWPANLAHDGSPEVLVAFAAFGERNRPNGRPNCKNVVYGQDRSIHGDHNGGIAPYNGGYPDSGSPSRFFFSAKANADDRLGSKHPTVKPVGLMCWLLRLVTPHGGHVLDPFAGSGSTGMAAMREGFDATLIELEGESVKDIRNRLDHVHGHDTPLFSGAKEPSMATPDLFDGAA